ncbi:hypothetical protein [Hyalangium rubrum]|uniref:Uncharacterized protein n=1 Tax=Hyalangium rubrum TaxID=3103134 RepID=A0ABU5HH93_9BACT|nr:hypothetical protein [Hyalangium sp. s54d21]MDY7231460.1 hypothetical protein [Hyalangium sp. s54d21]
MRSPARRQPSDAEIHARLSARIEALEDRVRRLEQHVRRAVSSSLRAQPATSARHAQAAAPARQERPRPRCPGCTLELPRGRKRETCVWCGFHFSAVRRRARKG